MIYRRMNRVPRSAFTKFGSPCRTLHVNWETFSTDDKADGRGKKSKKHAK